MTDTQTRTLQVEECEVNPYSSRICERGTQGCTVGHATTAVRTLQVISEHAGDMPVSLIKGELNLSQGLGMDPQDIADMTCALETEFGIYVRLRDFPHPLSTVAEVVAMVEGIRKQALEVK